MASFPPSDQMRDFAGTPGGTPEQTRQYVGRFAPSPTGSLHLGSLVAALGSFADARHSGGRWLLRMEDLDTARVVPGCADTMLRTLERCGLTWDGAVEYQSGHLADYAAALAALSRRGLTFKCSCPRSALDPDVGYPGTCRSGPSRPGPTATRFRVADTGVAFSDRAQGECHFSLRERGDVVIRRRDGAFTYQLAVVVDDARQGVTDVVRGADLLDSTPWQIALQHALGLPQPRYLHLPLVAATIDGKLSKSRGSVALDVRNASRELCAALRLLRQDPPATLELEPAPVVVAWACRQWRPQVLRGLREVRADA